MRSIRSAHGGTLALVVTCIVIIAIVGIALFYLMRIVGGNRELDYAARSGNLNVAKQAILRPGITLDSAEDKQFGAFKDPQASNLVNLRVYNRLVGQALLVALNASADGTPGTKANAERLIRMLQGDNGVGEKLKTALATRSNGTGDFFAALGLSNNTRMLGGENGATASINQVSWCEGRDADVGATNLVIRDSRTNGRTPRFDIDRLMPAPVTNDATFAQGGPLAFPGQTRNITEQNCAYLRGYKEIAVTGIDVPIIGVPVQPGAQPHLVSSGEFSAGLGKFQSTDRKVPPNAFEFGASKKEGSANASANTGRDVIAFSRALVGSLNSEDAPSIPRGYIVVNNPVGLTHTGRTLPDDSVFQNELAGDGIQVDRTHNIFTANNAQIPAWQDHNRRVSNGEIPGHQSDNSCPFYQANHDGMYTMEGSDSSHEATSQELHQIDNGGTSCNDENSTGTPSGGPSTCSPYVDAFIDRYGGAPAGPATEVGGFTGVDTAKADLVNRFPMCGPLNFSQANPANPSETKHTGLRFVGSGDTPNAPTDNLAWGHGQRTPLGTNGTIRQLFLMVTGNSNVGDNVNAFLKRRIRQIKPTASDSEIDNLLARPVPLSAAKHYIYMKTDGTLAFDTNKPDWVDELDRADGKPFAPPVRRLQVSYPRGTGWVNSKNENGIHDQMYLCQNGTVFSNDKATLVPGSGYNNILGEIEFENWAENSGAQYCCTD